MSPPDDAWKRGVLEDFRQWLDDLPQNGPAAEDDLSDASPGRDLYDLYAELAALRQELRLQNREQAKAGRELAKAAAAFEAAAHPDPAPRQDEDLAAFGKRVAKSAENRCLLSFLEICDALERGRGAAVRLRERRRPFLRPPRGITGVVEGYELAIRRFERMLSRFSVQRVQTVGHPFDSRTMHATEVRPVKQARDGVVVEELLSGYTRGGEILRLAEVAVNRLDTPSADGRGFDGGDVGRRDTRDGSEP